jgi:chlorobactene glucosyltransferase
MIIFYSILTVLVATSIVVVYNFFTAPVLKVFPKKETDNELISVLIPARNEGANIAKCLNSVIRQKYLNIEIIVLDDGSSDNTYINASEIANKDKRIRIVKGNELPEDYTGKNWACYQLSLLATGNYLLFIDADVELKQESLIAAFTEMNKYKVDLLSVFPTQKLYSLGEWLIVPLMNWLLLTFLPLVFVYSKESKLFAAANGQFMMFRRDVYNLVGGHKSVNKTITEDIEFVKLLKANKYRVRTYLGGELVYCRMYNNIGTAFRGFSKNFYPGFNINPVLFLTLLIFFLVCFNVPAFLLFYSNIFTSLVILIILQRILISKISRQNLIINVLLFPFQFLMLFMLGVNSVILSQRKKRIWKGRTF